MGGRSQPRPRSADRHRRSAGRGATASVPATSTTGAVSGRTAISCPATPKANRTRRTSHLHPHPAVIAGRGGEGLDPGGRNGRSPCRRPGGPAPKRWQRRRHRSPVTPRTQPRSRRASTGGDRPPLGEHPATGRPGGPQPRTPPERDLTGGRRGAEHPSPASAGDSRSVATRSKRNVRGSNHGRRSRKFNQDCTIRHSCPWAGPCWTVP